MAILTTLFSKSFVILNINAKPAWIGTSLQLRLIQRVFSNANGIDLCLMICSSPIPRMRKWPISLVTKIINYKICAVILADFIIFSDSNIKVDCISVSTSPVKSTIDDHIQQLFDALLTSLRRSITNEVQTIDTFLTSASDALSTRPQSVEEIGEANAKHAELATEKLQACDCV